MSPTGDVRTSLRRRGSESMCTSSTHEAQTLTPSVLSSMQLHTARSASTCCGQRCRSVPKLISSHANVRMVSRKECCAKRVGSACGSSRVEEVTTKTSGGDDGCAATRPAVSSAMVAAGLDARMPCSWRQMRLAAPMAMATDAACDDHAAAMSPRLLRVVCWPPPHVFLGLCTTEARTELERIPAAASWVASKGSTAW